MKLADTAAVGGNGGNGGKRRKFGGNLAEIWRESAEAAIGVRQEDSRRDPVLLM